MTIIVNFSYSACDLTHLSMIYMRLRINFLADRSASRRVMQATVQFYVSETKSDIYDQATAFT